MRATRSHRDNRRAHHALSDVLLSRCPECSAPHLRHRACTQCGKYNGKVVIDVKAAVSKKEKKMKARQKELTAQGGK